MHNFIGPVVFLTASLTAATSQAQYSPAQPDVGDYNIALRASLWKLTPEQLTVSAGPGGTDLDLSRAFGFETKWVKDMGFVLRGGNHKLRLNYLKLDYAGAATLDQAFTFGDREFGGAAPSSAALEWTTLRADYEFDFVSTPRGFAGVIAGVLFSRVTTDISNLIAGASMTDAQAPIPAFGGIVSVFVIPRELSITVEVSGVRVPDVIDRFEGQLLSIDAYASLYFGRNFTFESGYRSLDVTYAVEEDAGHLQLKGPYVGASVRF
jgi:hypothetical protein